MALYEYNEPMDQVVIHRIVISATRGSEPDVARRRSLPLGSAGTRKYQATMTILPGRPCIRRGPESHFLWDSHRKTRFVALRFRDTEVPIRSDGEDAQLLVERTSRPLPAMRAARHTLPARRPDDIRPASCRGKRNARTERTSAEAGQVARRRLAGAKGSSPRHGLRTGE